MNKIVLICTLLIFSLSAFAQTQRELIPGFTEKGKSYLGFDLGLITGASGQFGTSAVYGLSLKPTVSYQYNVLNRLAVGGKISNTSLLQFRSPTGERGLNHYQSLSASISARYYPLRNKGFFIEGEYIREVNFLPNTRNQHVQKFGLSPGYTFIVGKNKNIALDLKMNITYQPNQRGFLSGLIPTPTIGVKIPLGKKKITAPAKF